MSPESAAERKRKRLEAWRNRQKASAPALTPAPKVSMSLGGAANKLKLNKKNTAKQQRPKPVAKPSSANPFFADDEHDGDDDSGAFSSKRQTKLLTLDTIRASPSSNTTTAEAASSDTQPPPRKRQKKGRWDKAPSSSTGTREQSNTTVDDALDQFMEQLEAGAMGNVTTQRKDDAEFGNLDPVPSSLLKINVSGSMMPPKLKQQQQAVVSGGVITPEELDRLTGSKNTNKSKTIKQTEADDMDVDDDEDNTNNKNSRDDTNEDPRYTHSDWESDAAKSEPETDDEEEEKARRAFIEALKSAPPFAGGEHSEDEAAAPHKKPELAAEVKNEKQRREQHLKDLEAQAEQARNLALKSGAPEFGRLFNDAEGGVMEEAERDLDAAMAAPDALTVLAELNKKKELKAVDHSKIDYLPFKKNLYVVPRALANLSNDEVINLRAKLKVRVRGHHSPAPVTTFEQCGLSEKIMKILEKQNITKPFPVQAQCIPCIMAGRDAIGIAKTGSGKTLAYLLPMLRHIGVQPPIAPNESGPIGLILAPARELAYQIHAVCKQFGKNLGLNNSPNVGCRPLD